MTNGAAARLTIACLALATSALAQPAADPLAGTWVLNLERSTIAGPPPRSQTTRLEPAPGGIREIVERVNADGTTTRWDVTVTYDGRDHAVQGDPSRDTVAFTRVDARTFDVVNKKGGSVVSRMRIVVAQDGRSRTNASGATVMFFDRQ